MRSGQSGGNSITFFLGLASLIRPGGGANALARRREFRPGIRGLESRIVLSRALEIPSPAALGAAERADAEDLGAARHDRDRPGAPPAGGASRLPRFATVRGAFTWTKGGKNWGLRPRPRVTAGWAYNPERLATFNGEDAIKAVGVLDFSKLRFNGDLAVIPAGGDAALIGIGRPSSIAAAPGYTATIAVPIAAEAGLVINPRMADAGTVILAGANRPFRLLRIDGGTLWVSGPENLGLADAEGPGLVVMGNPSIGRAARPTLQFVDGSAIVFPEGLQFELLADSSVLDAVPGAAVQVAGPIYGVGGLIKSGSGSLALTGPLANSFAGPVVVEGGTLRLGKASRWNRPEYAIASPGGLMIRPGAAVVLDGDYQIDPERTSVMVEAGATLDLNQRDVEVRDLVMDGFLSGGPGAYGGGKISARSLSGGPDALIRKVELTLENPDAANPAATEFAGAITEYGSLVMSIPNGSLTLSGANTHTGGTSVLAGTLLVTGSVTGSQVNVNPPVVGPKFDAVLGGTGVIDRIAVERGGILAPGAVGEPGILTMDDLLQMPGSVLRIDLEGPVAGIGHDKLVINGRLDRYGYVRLELVGGFAPDSEEPITIVENNGENWGINPFEGLPEGATVSVGAFTGTISYEGGDVVLIPKVAPPQG